MVIGMGESKTPMPFIKACEQFKTLDVLYEGNGEEAEKADAQKGDKAEQVVPITSLKTIRKTIMSIIDEQTEDGEWMNLGELGIFPNSAVWFLLSRMLNSGERETTGYGCVKSRKR